MGPVPSLPPIWQDSCSPLPFWLACCSLPPPSQCHSTLQLFLEAGITMETLAGLQTLPSQSTPGQALSTRNSPSAESRHGMRNRKLEEYNLWIISFLTFPGL